MLEKVPDSSPAVLSEQLKLRLFPPATGDWLACLHYQMEASSLYWNTHTLPDGGEPPTGHGSGALHPLTQ